MVGPHDHHHQLQQQQQHKQAARCSCGDPTCNQFVLVNVSADPRRPLIHHHGLVQAAAMTAQPIYYAGPTSPYGQSSSAAVAYHAVVDDSSVGFYHQHVQSLVPAGNMHHGQVLPLMAAGPQYLPANSLSGSIWPAPASVQGYVDQLRPHNGSQPVWTSRSIGSEVPHRLTAPSQTVDARSIIHNAEADMSAIGVLRSESESAADLATETNNGGGWRGPLLEASEKDVGGNKTHATAAFDDDDSKPTKEISRDVARTSLDNLAG